jgi:hypothetical protein
MRMITKLGAILTHFSKASFPGTSAMSNNRDSLPEMLRAFLRAYYYLIIAHILLWRGFPAIHRFVAQFPTSPLSRTARSPSTRTLIQRLNFALIFIPKQTYCLVYAAAGTCLLRSFGIRALMVIGVYPSPFSAHSWIEVDGAPLPGPFASGRYLVIDRV